MERIILASASPRRREILSRFGVRFTVIPAAGEEHITETDPEAAVQQLALAKARETALSLEKGDIAEGTIVIGADTVVVFDGKILGKPKDEAEAASMLAALQGNIHHVYTGTAWYLRKDHAWQTKSFAEVTDVEFYPVSEKAIDAYIRTGEPMDKAGAYGIQGAWGIYVKGIRGDYNNVVGLPAARLFHEAEQAGINLLEENKQ